MQSTGRHLSTFSPFIQQPICIEKHRDRTYKGEDAIVAGWGTLRDGGTQSSQLRFTDVRVWGNPACKLSYGLRAPGGILPCMLCANKPEQNKDSCSVSVR